jgi:hypothetical protein
MKLIIATVIIACAIGAGYAQTPPTLRIVTETPGLPSDLFYGNVKVKPLRVRPGSNPPQFITINDNDFFVQQQYIDFLTRMPDTAGFNFWLGQINSCNGNQSCIDVTRINDSGAFFLSIEFQDTGYLVERMYKTAFGDATGNSGLGGNHNITAPIVTYAQFLPDVKQIGNGVIVNQGNWQAQLEANKVSFSQAFVQRAQFTSAYGNSMTPSAFVDALFLKIGVTPTSAERNQAIGEFQGAADISNATNRAKAFRDVAENGTLATAEKNRAFVLMQYFGYLRRDPNNGNGDTDYTGYDFWLGKLNGANGNFISAEMVKAFITSPEYLARF